MKHLILSMLIGLAASNVSANASLSGLIDGSGFDVQVTPFSPDTTKVKEAMAQMASGEAVWSSVLESAFDPEKNVAYLKGDSDVCYIDGVRPFKNVAAYYNVGTNALTFCKKFFEATESEQTRIFLQELSRFGMSQLGEKHSSNQTITEGFGGIYGNILGSPNHEEFKKNIYVLRTYLDKYATNLILRATEELVLPSYLSVDVASDSHSRVAFPMALNWDSATFIPQHFLEYVSSLVWTKYGMFSAKELTGSPIQCPMDENLPSHVVCNDRFAYILSGKIYRIGIRKDYPSHFPPQTPPIERCGGSCVARTLNPNDIQLRARKIGLDQLNPRFRDYLNVVGFSAIRTIQTRGSGWVNDYVFKFE